MTLAAGSLTLFMDALVAVENTCATKAVSDYGLVQPRVYRWKPVGNIELPAIYNWMAPSPAEYMEVGGHRHRDILNLTIRVAVARTERDEEMAKIEGYADAVREVLDAELRVPQPLGNTCKWAERPSMRMVGDEFDGAQVLAVEFALTAKLDRIINPNP